jgi:hypothetical protein
MEPERPIEKLLRAFAKKRREQAGEPPGFELHNATRRLLQGEVARRAPRPREGNFFLRLLAPIRPRLAFALSVVAITILGAALLLPSLSASKSRSKLASQQVKTFRESEKAVEQPAALPPLERAPAGNPPGTPVADNDLAANRKKLDTAAGEETKNEPAGAATRARRADAVDTLEPAGQDRSRGEVQLKTVTAGGAGGFGGGSRPAGATGAVGQLAYKAETDSRDVPAANAAAPARAGESLRGSSNYSLAAAEPVDRKLQFDDFGTAAAKAPATGGGGGGRGGSAVTQTATARFYALNDETRSASASNLNRQKFVQSNGDSVNTLARSNAAPVLTNFAVEQNGGQMRVVDSDGSVYDGYLEIAAAPAVTLSGKPALAGQTLAKDVTDKEKTFEGSGNYFFRVAGTNRSLKQNVVFTGNFVNLTNSASLLPASGATALGGRSQAETTPAVMQQLPLQNSFINGTIQINNNREIPIQATPSPPSQR